MKTKLYSSLSQTQPNLSKYYILSTGFYILFPFYDFQQNAQVFLTKAQFFTPIFSSILKTCAKIKETCAFVTNFFP